MIKPKVETVSPSAPITLKKEKKAQVDLGGLFGSTGDSSTSNPLHDRMNKLIKEKMKAKM